MTPTGTHFNYYQVCKRKLWLFANGINMELCMEKRVNKMLKLCRKYLNWIQNSVFEGEITELQLKQLEASARTFMDEDEDSIIIFSSRAQMFMDKRIIGVERNTTDNFL